MENGRIMLKYSGKTFELASRERLDTLLRKKGFGEKIDELSIRYLNVVADEIEEWGLEDKDKILAEVIVIERLNRAFGSALREACKILGYLDNMEDTKGKEEIIEDKRGKVKSDIEAFECFTKVADKMFDISKNAYGKVRKDLSEEGKIRISKNEEERIKKETPRMLFNMCKHGEGKEFIDLSEKVMKICVQEINRLGRHLTKEEVFEICENVKYGRK